MARLPLTRPRLFGIGLAIASFAFAACGGKTTSVTPLPSATPIATPTGSAPAALSSPCASSLGIAYEPDGGNGNGLNGIQVIHFLANTGQLCGAVTPTSTAAAVRLDSAVGPIAVAGYQSSNDTSGVDTLALLYNATSGGFSFAQDLFGAGVGQLVPAGSPYDLSVPPTPVPAVTLSPGQTPTPVPAATPTAAVMSDASSITILNDSTSAVGLVVGPATVPQSIVGITSLANAPPQYGSSVPFIGTTNTLMNPTGTSFNNIRAMTDASGNSNILVRGTNDLIVIGVSTVGTGYQFNIEAEDNRLGSNVPLRGYGRMAIDPQDASRALVGGTTAGLGNQLTLVTGMPSAITESSTVTLPGNINAVSYSPYGTYAAVATSAGIVIVSGTSGNALSVLTPFGPNVTAYTPTYTNCNGTQSTMTNVLSVAFAVDNSYLVALGTGAGVSCASGYNATLIAVPFNDGTGATPVPSTATPTPNPSGSPSPSPFPTFFQQNNVIAPPTGADYLYVH